MTLQRRHLIGGLAALAAGPSWASPAAAGDVVRWPEVTLLDGSHWAPAPERAQVVVFWSLSCPFCKRHNAHIDKLHRAAAAGNGPGVLTVSRDRDALAVRRYLANNHYGFPVSLDADMLAAALSTRRIIPLTMLIDRQGRLKQAVPGEMFEEDVMDLLKLS